MRVIYFVVLNVCIFNFSDSEKYLNRYQKKWDHIKKSMKMKQKEKKT